MKTTKELGQRLHQGIHDKVMLFSTLPIYGGGPNSTMTWKGIAPSRFEDFCWVAISWKGLTIDKLVRRKIITRAGKYKLIGVPFPLWPLCKVLRRLVGHLFLH